MRLVKQLLPLLVPPLASGFIRLLRMLTRQEFVGADIPASFWQRGAPVILTFWHDQLLMMVNGYQGPGAKILISPSEDGELIARTMARFGQGAVRGSSSRHGRAAFKALLQLSREPFVAWSSPLTDPKDRVTWERGGCAIGPVDGQAGHTNGLRLQPWTPFPLLGTLSAPLSFRSGSLLLRIPGLLCSIGVAS